MKPASDEKPLPCPPVALSARDASRACGMSLSLWYRANTLGLCPEPAAVCTKKTWSYRQLIAWSDANCPARDSAQWQAILARLREERP